MSFHGVDFFNVNELLTEEESLVRSSVIEFLIKFELLIADSWHKGVEFQIAYTKFLLECKNIVRREL
ncbi:hypothetical protein DRP05_04105 [Archaeoglobales archaeon]|nr:MAG: hypothetical protein DRP05_04105 [Archaeoglobales archaeon]